MPAAPASIDAGFLSAATYLKLNTAWYIKQKKLFRIIFRAKTNQKVNRKLLD